MSMMNRRKKSQKDYTLMASSVSFPFYGSAGGLRVCIASPAVEGWSSPLTYSRGDNIEHCMKGPCNAHLIFRLEAHI
jgi:hypothetical protein